MENNTIKAIDFMTPLHQHGLITDKEFSVLQKSDPPALDAALLYCKWFDKVLKRTYVVNLIKRRKKNVKKESEKVSESESNS